MKRLAALLLTCGVASAWALPGYEEVRHEHRPSDSVLLDRQGEVLHRLRTDASVRRGPWIALVDMSPALRTAM
ncbi:MAG: hypothetical protein ABI919_08000, partial [Ramlibacter sp.]